MFATASRVRRWFLVEVPGSWGHDALSESALGASQQWTADLQAAGIRPLAIRRDLDRSDPGSGVRVFAVEGATDDAGGWCATRMLADHAEALAVGAELAADGHLDRSRVEPWERWDERITLVCTNGRHDACCASQGRPVVRALRTTDRSDTVWESSHVGGDRFAANVVVLPDGLYFGRCEPDAAAGLLDRLAAGRVDLDRFRGRATRDVDAQAAEYFVRSHLGIDRLDDVEQVTVVDRRGAQRVATVRLTPLDGVDRPSTVTVRFRHTTELSAEPLTCGGPAGVEQPVFVCESIGPPEPTTSARSTDDEPEG